ncbi:germination protein M [Pseudobutyrivibrio sp. YE44]|uniref:GerMN domain-containing protein n=1 Tax=Pseudobutyrivibrio sp. YE44 TaxID=1520802 RepID=UPI000880BB40|nr:GerMN domain-containing protein [Pseudobutyrivibrio sp. YE44]SDB12126.1 germination protein M [Pseudobutyrivibrio sp. YE44]
MKRFLTFLVICTLMLSLVGCSNNEDSSEFKIYYVNTDKTSITPVGYELQGQNTHDQIEEAISKLQETTEDIDYVTTIPSGVEFKSWKLNDGALELFFVGDYDSLDIYTEILVRAAIVKTLSQIEGVKNITFYINNVPLTDSTGETVGAMTADTFIEDFGQETDSLLQTDLTLYFASADGMSLVPENRHVYYSRNVSREKVVIEQLMKGPDNQKTIASLPTGTKLNSISVSDNGVCIVNFDATLETAVSGVTEQVTLYTIVNSLTELDTVKQVQILVNGETPHMSNIDVDLSTAVSRNDNIINNNYVEEDETYAEDEEYVQEEEDVTSEEITQD